ncbi:ABC transporter permease [Patulibacter sp. NPDC049589]|uniref:ABC transporter permease n=1 Tax=Patulibacter sp. NPDC049589 TaxID=3154731 RepID=UPI00342D6D95
MSTTTSPGLVGAAAPPAAAIPFARPRARRTRVPVGLVLSLLLLALLVAAAVAPGLFTGTDPNAASAADTLTGPSGAHWFGTDQNGRDIFSRVVHGAGPSLLIGVAASALALVLGTALGVLAAQGGRVGDRVVSRLLDVLLSVPGLLLALLIIAALGPGTRNSILGIALISTPGYARLVRGEVLRIRGSAFVEAAVGLGWSRPQVVLRHVVPNAVGPVIVLATIGVGAAIGVGSSLSFLGLGPQPPTAEWGAMLASSRDYLSVAWWPAVFPGVAITLTVLTVTVVGRRLQLRAEGRVAR